MRTLFWLGLGAAAMYYFDPEQGRRRRALARDRLAHARRVMREQASRQARHLRNRAQGLAAEARGTMQTPQGAQHLGR